MQVVISKFQRSQSSLNIPPLSVDVVKEEWIVKGNEIVHQILEHVPKKGDTPPLVPETAP